MDGISVDPRFIAVARLRALQAIIVNKKSNANGSSREEEEEEEEEKA